MNESVALSVDAKHEAGYETGCLAADRLTDRQIDHIGQPVKRPGGQLMNDGIALSNKLAYRSYD